MEGIEDNKLVKSMLNAGFSPAYIAEQIEKGGIKLEKSRKKVEKAEFDEKDDKAAEEAVEQMKHTEEDEYDEGFESGEEKEKKEEEDKALKAKKDKLKKGKDCAKAEEAEEDMEKAEMKKELETVKKSLETITDSFGEMKDLFKSFMESTKNKAPEFKSEALGRVATLEKSMNFEKDDTGKLVLSVTKDRNAVREAIAKSINGCKDEGIKKSLQADAMAYLTDPYADGSYIGKSVAYHLFNEHGIRLID